ncbi:MAG TPA: DUF2970 domain-containing protein [Usitatibacter sp.]|nr:DUF2970 domain-containing protein [Usitatibacter sp.]
MKNAFKAVLWGFLGIRRKSEYEADTQRLKPQHVIAAGLVAAAVFVLLLFGVVKLVTR